jgi:hypothetical protein
MVEYITSHGPPYVRATGSTQSNAARRAFVELIQRHDLDGITIKRVHDLGGTPERLTESLHIDYTDADDTPHSLSAFSRALDAEETEWEVLLSDTFC